MLQMLNIIILAIALLEVPFLTFTNEQKHYTIQYPHDWTVNETLPGFDVFFMAPKQPNGKSLANVSIISGNLPSDATLDIFSRENMKNLAEGNSTLSIIENGKTSINGMPSNWTLYTRSDDQTKIIHYFFIHNQIGYLITCGSTIETYEQYQPTFERIVNSMQFERSQPKG